MHLVCTLLREFSEKQLLNSLVSEGLCVRQGEFLTDAEVANKDAKARDVLTISAGH